MENPMFRTPLSLLVLSIALTSCSKSSTAPTGSTTDSRGTPVTGENAFDTSTRLAWSQATNEVLGDAKSGGTLGAAGLAAVRTVDGATRFLTNNPALFPTLTSDGAQVYADEITADSTVLRRRSLGPAAVARIAAVPGLDAFAFVLSTDGRYVAYAPASLMEPLEPDTIRVLDTIAGVTKSFVPGTPVVFSPDDGTLLMAPPTGGYAALTLSSGASTTVDFGLPGGAILGAFRWDGSGLHVLYSVNNTELHISTYPGADLPVAVTPEAIVGPSPVWSPDGTRIALWTTSTENGDIVYRLYVASPVSHTVSLVALGRSTGGAIAWSSDGSRLAYLYGGRLFLGSATTGSVVAATERR
jgi:hypothetical protein